MGISMGISLDISMSYELLTVGGVGAGGVAQSLFVGWAGGVTIWAVCALPVGGSPGARLTPNRPPPDYYAMQRM